MCFHGTAVHPDGGRNFGVATALQKQIYDLLLARPEPYRSRFIHYFLPGETAHPLEPTFWENSAAAT